jgi:hypothetical protein
MMVGSSQVFLDAAAGGRSREHPDRRLVSPPVPGQCSDRLGEGESPEHVIRLSGVNHQGMRGPLINRSATLGAARGGPVTDKDSTVEECR